MNEDHIVGDFDLTTHQWLEGESAAIDTSGRKETLRRYRKYRGLELTEPLQDHTPDTFVNGDLHLGHANIIRYCARPFSLLDPGEMDQVLIQNWNFTVGDQDEVCYLGDLCYVRSKKPESEYRNELKGNITFIRGNHDVNRSGTLESQRMQYEGIPFILSHDPESVEPEPDEWVIHGHLHNNDLRDYPFINFRSRRVNVSAEVVGYRPVSLREITDLIRKGLLECRQQSYLIRPNIPGPEACSAQIDDPHLHD